ncbi:hypothetical protein LTR53_019931, partial [Teratosphaeriaceae sp. CCFEE 6253]
MARLDELLIERICHPLEAKYLSDGERAGLSVEEVEKELGKEQEAKGLTETEHLMLMNHAPKCVEQLVPMVEGCEERFTGEEQQVIVDAVTECYRVDEPREGGGEGEEMEVEQDADGGAENGVGK